MQFTQARIVAFMASAAAAANIAHPKHHATHEEPSNSVYDPANPAHQPPSNITVVTTTVSNYVTYCPESTTFSVGHETYTAIENEWITVTHCPEKCTITYQPTATVSPTICPGTIVPVWHGTYVHPTGVVPTPAGNGTYNKPTGKPVNTDSGSGSSGSENSPNEFEGAGNKLVTSSAALAITFGAIAYFL